jgi:uncharacterized protein (UPF0332 family)
MFDPLEFLRVAYELKDISNEAEIRTSIGRAYYATFLFAREWLRAKGWPIYDDYSDHGEVIKGLKNYKGKTASDKMYDLHKNFRKIADYELRGRSINEVDADDAYKLANDIITKIRSGP